MYLTPAYKWTLAGLTIVFVGLGVWLAVAVTRNANNGAISSTTTSTDKVATSIAQTPASPSSDTAPTDSGATATTDNSSSSSADTQEQTVPETHHNSQSTTSSSVTTMNTTTSNSSSSLAASMNMQSMNGKTTITVVANLPVVIGFDSLSGSYPDSAYKMTQTIDGLQGSHTLIVRSKDGQQTTFNISSNSSTTTSASQS